MKTLCLILALLPLLASAEVYKWTDENGNVHFGDRPKNLNKAEVVEIREQKTGSMVSDSQKAAYKFNARVEAANDKYEEAINRLPATSSGPSIACNYNRSMIRYYENEWESIRKRGYKQSQRNYYQDKISFYKSEEASSCN